MKNADPAHAATSRRSFLGTLGFGAVTAAVLTQAGAMLRSLFPNVLYERARRFRVGDPQTLPEGVSFLPDERVFVVREGKTFQALSAQCTHLGCTVKFVKKQEAAKGSQGYEFHCPCHGSKFKGDGTPYSGPAPKPLEALLVELAPEDGQLVVNADRRVPADFRLTV